jgi:uncharacterized protein
MSSRMKITSTSPENRVVHWKSVAVYYALACLISWPFFAWRDLFPASWASTAVPGAVRNLLLMWGPGIAALICFYIFRKNHTRTITFTGTSLWRSLVFYLAPFAIWLILILINPEDGSIKATELLSIMPFGFMMILGEELGWRGFLQDALNPLKPWKRWALLAVMWELWHFTRGLMEGEWFQIVLRKSMMFALVLIMTIVIGKITERNKSLLVAVALHSWVNIQFEFAQFNTHLAGLLSLILWAILLWKWKGNSSVIAQME